MKVRGGKKPNVTPVVSYTDASRLLQGFELTQRDVEAKVAEFFDPIGMFCNLFFISLNKPKPNA